MSTPISRWRKILWSVWPRLADSYALPREGKLSKSLYSLSSGCLAGEQTADDADNEREKCAAANVGMNSRQIVTYRCRRGRVKVSGPAEGSTRAPPRTPPTTPAIVLPTEPRLMFFNRAPMMLPSRNAGDKLNDKADDSHGFLLSPHASSSSAPNESLASRLPAEEKPRLKRHVLLIRQADSLPNAL